MKNEETTQTNTGRANMKSYYITYISHRDNRRHLELIDARNLTDARDILKMRHPRSVIISERLA